MKLANLFFVTFFITLSTFKIAFCNPEILDIDLRTSKYMKLDQKITRIAVGNPDVATVVQVPNSPNEFLIVTHSPGSTSLFIWTYPSSNEPLKYTINVSPEDTGLARIIKSAIGLPSVQVKTVKSGDKIRVLLTGTVRNQYERNKAVQTARLYVGGGSDSSVSIGSSVDMTIKTQIAADKNSSSNAVGGSEVQDKGEVIDLIHMLHPTQIRLEAQVIAIRPQDRKELGIRYGNDPLNVPGVFAIGETGNGTSLRHSTWAHGNINLTLSALITKSKAKVLSRPSITTMSGEEAVIQVGGEIPYTTYNDNGRAHIEFKNYGIILQLKPVADLEDRVTSTIHAEVSNMSGETVEGNPILDIRRADSVITVRSGSTMIIGGLMDSSEQKTVNKFPILGNIPILGEFFKYTSKSKDKQELIILVTPYIVEEEDISQAKMSDSMQEFYNKGQAEKDSFNTVDLNNSPSQN